MKANELRLGNLLRTTITHITINVTVDEFLEILNEPEDHQLEPIPLTEEWLLKLGFKKGGVKLGCQEYWIDGALGVYKMIGDYPHFAHGAINDIKIESVHKLQNLYFDLTGKELTNLKDE